MEASGSGRPVILGEVVAVELARDIDMSVGTFVIAKHTIL